MGKTTKIFLVLLCILLVPSMASAMRIDVNVKGKIGGYIEYFEMEKEVDSLQEFSLQWYNTESVSCESRMEFKIYRENESFVSVWSQGKKMLAGVSDHFEAYWLPAERGNYSVKIVIHHCHEFIESGLMNFSVGKVAEPEEVIDMGIRNLPERKIEITLKPERDLENVVIVPTNYPQGWVFNAEKTGKISAGEEFKKVIEYVPSVWIEETVSLQAVSSDGTYSSEKTEFRLKEVKYFWDEHGYNLFLLVLLVLVLSVSANFRFFFKNRRKVKHRKL